MSGRVVELASAQAAVTVQARADAPRARFAELVSATEPDTAQFVRAQLMVAARRRAAGKRDREVEVEAKRRLAPPPEQAAVRSVMPGNVSTPSDNPGAVC